MKLANYLIKYFCSFACISNVTEQYSIYKANCLVISYDCEKLQDDHFDENYL